MGEVAPKRRVAWEVVGMLVVLTVFLVMVLVWLASPRDAVAPTEPAIVPTSTSVALRLLEQWPGASTQPELAYSSCRLSHRLAEARWTIPPDAVELAAPRAA